MEPGDGEADPLTAFQTPREEPPIMMAVAEDTSDEVDTWITKNISVFATKTFPPPDAGRDGGGPREPGQLGGRGLALEGVPLSCGLPGRGVPGVPGALRGVCGRLQRDSQVGGAERSLHRMVACSNVGLRLL